MSELKGPSTKTALQRGWIGLLDARLIHKKVGFPWMKSFKQARVIHKKRVPADTSYREAMTKETLGGMELAEANGTFRRRTPPARSWAIKKGGRLSVAHLFGFGCGFTGRLFSPWRGFACGLFTLGCGFTGRLFGFGCLLLGSFLCL